MLVKRTLIAIIVISFYINCLVNYPAYNLKNWGVNQVLDYYVDQVSDKVQAKLLYNPGLREFYSENRTLNVEVVLPTTKNFPQTLDSFLVNNCEAIVECSELDSWHCSKLGNEYLTKIRKQAYRIVIFDGGHHLPTLGLEPDIIIIPEMNGYAVHGYMLDGIKTKNIVRIVKEINAPIVIAQVSRWFLVKNEKSLQTVTSRIMEQVGTNRINNEFYPVSDIRMSKYNHAILAYIDKNYGQNQDLFITNLNKLGLDDVNIIYLAFDYKWISLKEASAYTAEVGINTKIPVEQVNEPVKVSNGFWGGS